MQNPRSPFLLDLDQSAGKLCQPLALKAKQHVAASSFLQPAIWLPPVQPLANEFGRGGSPLSGRCSQAFENDAEVTQTPRTPPRNDWKLAATMKVRDALCGRLVLGHLGCVSRGLARRGTSILSHVPRGGKSLATADRSPQRGSPGDLLHSGRRGSRLLPGRRRSSMILRSPVGVRIVPLQGSLRC
jgi:hypothetical protein